MKINEIDQINEEVEVGITEEDKQHAEHLHLTEDELLKLDSKKNSTEIKKYINLVWKSILEIREKYGNYSKRCKLVGKAEEFNRKRPCGYKKFSEAKQDIDNIFQNYGKRRLNFKEPSDYSDVMDRLLSHGVETEYPVEDICFKVMVQFYKIFMEKYCPDEIYDIVGRYEFYYYANGREPTRRCNMFERFFVFYMEDNELDWKVKEEFRVLVDPFSWYQRSQQRKVTYCIKSESTQYLSEIINQIKSNKQRAFYLSLTIDKAEQVYSTINAHYRYSKCDLRTIVNRFGKKCSKRSCTIDCYPFWNTNWDIAFIDDIHLISEDPFGCNYTRALLSLKASHIYVYGQASAVATIRQICEIMGDTFTIEGTEPKHRKLGQAILGFDPMATKILQRMWRKALRTSFRAQTTMDIEKFLELYLNLHEYSISTSSKPIFRFRDVEPLLGMAKELSKFPPLYRRLTLDEILEVCYLPEMYVGENKGPAFLDIKASTNAIKHIVYNWLYHIVLIVDKPWKPREDEVILTNREDFFMVEYACKYLYKRFRKRVSWTPKKTPYKHLLYTFSYLSK